MHDLPTDWSALCVLIFLLGMRHGFDADHLATIDGLTRLSAGQQRTFSRHCGALFSLGHGLVVVAVAVGVGALTDHWAPPSWVAAFGAWLSIGFLLALGVLNLRAVLQAEPGRVVAMVGVKGAFLGRLVGARSPLAVAAVGALFALSFDTLSQSALFALTAAQFGGVSHALILSLLFVLGMLITDGLNGWWVARLIARADEIAAIASRVMGLAVSGVSLLVAALGLGRLLSPWLADWSDDQGVAIGALVLAVMGFSYVTARLLARGMPLQKKPS
jgi:nickel/cobalt transporter (NiCoT) family protein